MSIGTCLSTKPEIKGVNCYLQNLAADYSQVNHALQQDGCDLLPYLFCPESYLPEDFLATLDLSEEALAHQKIITTDDYHDASKVLADIERALALIPTYADARFDNGKEAFLSDLEELRDLLPRAVEANAEVQITRA